jgi:hypothetical protein
MLSASLEILGLSGTEVLQIDQFFDLVYLRMSDVGRIRHIHFDDRIDRLVQLDEIIFPILETKRSQMIMLLCVLADVR